jgi:hypothetical protein
VAIDVGAGLLIAKTGGPPKSASSNNLPRQKIPAANPLTKPPVEPLPTNVPKKTMTVIEVAEKPLPNPIRKGNAVDEWNDFLGPKQTDIHPRTGEQDLDRIVSQDGTRSVRFGEHEMGSERLHYHLEEWTIDSDLDFPTITITNDVRNVNP